jgi:hypothetical protein
MWYGHSMLRTARQCESHHNKQTTSHGIPLTYYLFLNWYLSLADFKGNTISDFSGLLQDLYSCQIIQYILGRVI